MTQNSYFGRMRRGRSRRRRMRVSGPTRVVGTTPTRRRRYRGLNTNFGALNTNFGNIGASVLAPAMKLKNYGPLMMVWLEKHGTAVPTWAKAVAAHFFHSDALWGMALAEAGSGLMSGRGLMDALGIGAQVGRTMPAPVQVNQPSNQPSNQPANQPTYMPTNQPTMTGGGDALSQALASFAQGLGQGFSSDSGNYSGLNVAGDYGAIEVDVMHQRAMGRPGFGSKFSI